MSSSADALRLRGSRNYTQGGHSLPTVGFYRRRDEGLLGAGLASSPCVPTL